ncbi:Uncharacterised protein [Chlamydia trachomatis]|nr:Uncharacterised protein [Chlamydia trachomatis]
MKTYLLHSFNPKIPFESDIWFAGVSLIIIAAIIALIVMIIRYITRRDRK